MNILMVTNTYSPHVGGVAKSVEAFTKEYRRRGHRVIVIAPIFKGAPEWEEDVIRVPAIQQFNGSDFSVRIPIPGLLTVALDDFVPDIVHSHHPFLLGDTAFLLAARENAPLVFTHHTLYEQYTHYVPGDSPELQRFVVELSTGYANLCDLVFAPSESIASLIKTRGTRTPVEAVPTGVNLEQFSKGDGTKFRKRYGIPPDAFLVGHVGRLAPEKNLDFLARAVLRFLEECESAWFLVTGEGPSKERILARFGEARLLHRLVLTGTLVGGDLVDAYHAMEVFAFASKTETQGMVLTEALAASCPVVALDAPGAREVVQSGLNGHLVYHETIDAFASALHWIYTKTGKEKETLREAARTTARQFSLDRCASRSLELYEGLLKSDPEKREIEDSMWSGAMRMIESEWEIWLNRAHAAGAAFIPPSQNSSRDG
ncbi:MAG: glycosyl transferase family 1 [Nitrospinae bacterium CG11_big_fil_rev_8_21_14_0_20_56_8]|nr:MAG: glycosyl transferase family 1 [Nitrospinae bacterium CG11_big_fil_rev_8_21_14_0_20_56_8]